MYKNVFWISTGAAPCDALRTSGAGQAGNPEGALPAQPMIPGSGLVTKFLSHLACVFARLPRCPLSYIPLGMLLRGRLEYEQKSGAILQHLFRSEPQGWVEIKRAATLERAGRVVASLS